MNDNMEAGADIHTGDGGYRLGTREGYDAFVKKRNPMNERIRKLIAQAGGIGYDDDGNELIPALVGSGLEKFAELIVRECARALDGKLSNPNGASMAYCDGSDLLEHFGVEK